MGKYLTMKNVPDNSPLADRLNKIMGKLNLLRARTMPNSFDFNKDTATCFYYTCLFEEWSHEVIRKLHLWKEFTDLYLKESEGQWKDYATQNLIFHIEHFGEVKGCYLDADGNLITNRSMTDEELAKYSVVADMYDENGIVETTTCDKFTWLTDVLEHDTDGKNPMLDTQSAFFGKWPRSEEFAAAMDKTRGSFDSAFVCMLAYCLQTLCQKLKTIDRTKNNVEELRMINKESRNILRGVFIEYKK